MIVARNIYKFFQKQCVLSDVSACFTPGQVSMLIGASGGGKTVFLKILLGLLTPDRGCILYGDKEFSLLRESERKKIRTEIGMVFQGSALFDSLSVEENLLLPLDILTFKTKKEKLFRVEEVLARVDLRGTNAKYPDEISGGMRKRVAIARALILNPKYFFCDEPNSGLDPKTSLLIDALIKDLTKEYQMTTVVISHDMNSVLEMADRVFFLAKGQLFWEGAPQELAHNELPALDDYIFASSLMQRVKKQLK